VHVREQAMNYSKVEPAPNTPAWVVAIICAFMPATITLLLVAVAALAYTLCHDDVAFLDIMSFVVGAD
jgi:hypothetical protein